MVYAGNSRLKTTFALLGVCPLFIISLIQAFNYVKHEYHLYQTLLKDLITTWINFRLEILKSLVKDLLL